MRGCWHRIEADLAELDCGPMLPEGTWGIIEAAERTTRLRAEFEQYLTERGDTE